MSPVLPLRFGGERDVTKADLTEKKFRERANCPPESGGQHGRDEVETMRGVVPEQSPHRIAASLFTNEVGGVVRAAATFICSHLWIGTKRPGADRIGS